MKRIAVLACALVVLAVLGPATADTDDVTGSVESATMTPTLPRTLFLVSPQTNGLTGFVTRIPVVDSEHPFVLENTGGRGQTGLEDLDVWFYQDIAGTGEPCPRDAVSDGEGGETGTICAGAGWAVVVLFSGSRAEFRLTH